MEKIQIPIKGMHCKSCEILVEDNLKEISGVKKCEVNCKEHKATIYYEGARPDMGIIEKSIRSAGYEIGQDGREPFFSKSVNDYKDLGIAFLFLIGAYFILKSFGWADISAGSAENPSGLLVVLLVGLTAGVSTCMALVGGLILGMSAEHASKHPEATAKEKFRPHLFFNLGRILGYAILGGVLGLVGSAFEISSFTTGVLIIAVGLVMIFLGLQLTGVFPRLKSLNFSLPKGVAKIFGIQSNEKEYSHKKAVVLGVLTFFLPCGFTQAMQVYALSTGSFFSGAAIMGVFALGTAPGLLSIGGLTSFVKGIFAKRFFKFAGLAVIALALFNINNGLGLLGWEIDWSSGNPDKAVVATDPNVKMVNGVQVVSMTENNRGYSPNKFTIVKDVPVRWVIDAQAPNSCASALVVPKLGIRKFLSAGENIIEFTPTEAGKLAFSCSMGMYTGSFNVVDSVDDARNIVTSVEAAEEDVITSACGMNNGAGGSCGGSCGGGCGCGNGNAN